MEKSYYAIEKVGTSNIKYIIVKIYPELRFYKNLSSKYGSFDNLEKAQKAATGNGIKVSKTGDFYDII